MKRLGIETQSVFGMPPLQQALLAAELGCGHISTGLAPVPWKLDCFPEWSLREDKQLRIELSAVLNDNDISISLAEGYAVRPQVEVASYASDLDLVASLGAKGVSSVCLDPDLNRAGDQFDQLAALVAERGMQFFIEFAPPHPINSLDKALALVESLGDGRAKLVIDTMHFFRSGSTTESLAAIDLAKVGYIQLCDAPAKPEYDDYFREACTDRRVPGEGDLPLKELLSILPHSLTVGLEIPIRARMNDQAQIEAVLRSAVASATKLF